MKANVSKEQLCAIKVHLMRHTYVTDRPAGAGGLNGLHHRFLRTYAFEYRVRAYVFRQLFDAGNSVHTSLRHDVGGAKLAGELLARRVPAHCDDPLRAHQLCGQYAEETDSPIADY